MKISFQSKPENTFGSLIFKHHFGSPQASLINLQKLESVYRICLGCLIYLKHSEPDIVLSVWLFKGNVRSRSVQSHLTRGRGAFGNSGAKLQ
jgi:hypothetical protein